MVSRLFSSAGSFISQVGEVLAPQVHSPLEDLRAHWKAIRNFYIDQKEDDIESFHASQLPEHLVAIGEILLDEEAALGDTGPCVEYFLQNKIVETLCALAERDSPPGVRKLVLQTLTMLLGDLSIPLLPHMSVHRPVRNLVRRLVLSNSSPLLRATPSTTPDSEFVGLLETLAKKLYADPSLAGIFIDELEYEEGSLLVFQGLLKHLWNPGSVGERARKGMIVCLQFPNMTRSNAPPKKVVEEVKAVKQDNVPGDVKQAVDVKQGEGGDAKQGEEVKSGGDIKPEGSEKQGEDETQKVGGDGGGSKTPSAPANEVATPPVMINYKNFVEQQVNELLGTFRSLPIVATPPPNPFSHFHILDNCKNRISFFCAIARITQNNVGQLLSHTFEEQFLDSTLGPALLNPNERDAISATIYVREILPSFSAPLLDNLLKFLVGDFVGPEKKDDEGVHLLRSTLISRITNSENLSVATCRLFSTMIGLHSHHVIYNLILRTISAPTTPPSPTRAISRPALSDPEFELLQPSISRFLTLFGNKFTPYSHSHSPTTSPNINTNNSSPNPTDCSGYDVYLVDAQHQVMIYKAACRDWPSTYQLSQQPIPYVGAFLEHLLTKLGRALDQDLDTNLIITGIFSKLCYHPISAMSQHLFLAHQPNLLPPNPTLYGTLEKLIEEIEIRAKRFVNIGVCIERARNGMAEENNTYDHSNGKIPNSELTFNPRRFLQAVIVLEEFCKELAATLQAKLVNEDKRQKV